MQFIIDHITGVVVAATVLLVIAAIQFRGREASIDATQYAAAKTRVLSIVEAVERDFSNIGSGMDSVKYAIIGLDQNASTKYFEFFGQTVQADPTVRTIRYEWTQTGTANLESGPVPTYTIERQIDGNVSGTSSGTVTEFSIDLMRADSVAVIANYADTRLVGVFLRSVSPVGVSKGVEETRWSRVFRPVNLARQ